MSGEICWAISPAIWPMMCYDPPIWREKKGPWPWLRMIEPQLGWLETQKMTYATYGSTISHILLSFDWRRERKESEPLTWIHKGCSWFNKDVILDLFFLPTFLKIQPLVDASTSSTPMILTPGRNRLGGRLNSGVGTGKAQQRSNKMTSGQRLA